MLSSWKIATLGFAIAAVGVVMLGCATRVPMEVQRTPTLDTRDVQRIAVQPFTGNQTIASALTTQSQARIGGLQGMTLVSYDTVRAARAAGRPLENYVDALFTGQVTNFTENTIRQDRPGYRRSDGAMMPPSVSFTRTVEVGFNYSLVLVRDGSIIGPVARSGRQSANAGTTSDLPVPTAMAVRIVEGQLRVLYRDLVPHTVRVERTLENERDNSAIRSQMNEARAMVRAGNHRLAHEAYLTIWEEHRSVAAAINASFLYEALGGTEEAAIFMEQVFDATGNPRARERLATLNRELAAQAGVEAFGDASGIRPAERVANHATDQLLRLALSEGGRVWIHNTATTNLGLVNDVIDNMTSNLLANTIPVIERGLLDLIMTEQNLQLEGLVADRDIVSIGNMAGANTVVVVGIIGSGAARRLQLRVLDITTATVIMQSGTGREWAI